MKALKQAVKSVIRAVERKHRASVLEKTVEHVTRAQLTADLRRLGIDPGDVVFVHSSLRSLGFVEGGASAVLDAMWDAIQPGGTLVVPTFYMLGTILGTCRDPEYVFDPRKLGSNLGALPDTFLARPGVRRSIHPTHSVSALGPQAEFIVGEHHRAPSTFGEGSPWHRFTQLDGKLLGLGISMGPVTYYHHVEDMLGAAYPIDVWMPETFQLRCNDFEGNRILVPVRPFRFELMERRIDHPSQNDLREEFRVELSRRGVLHSGKVGQGDAWWASSQAFFDALVSMSHEGRTIYARSGQ